MKQTIETKFSVIFLGIALAPIVPMGKDIFTTIWLLVAIIAALCNVLIIYAVRVNPHMHTTTNYFIVNMAIGDLLATISTTVGLLYQVYYGYVWIGNVVIGEYIYCRMACSFFYICMLSSIYSLIAITFDRFMAVSRPLKYKNNSSCFKFTILAIWALSFATPGYYSLKEVAYCLAADKLRCLPVGSLFDALLALFLGFIFPLVVMVILYMIIAYKLCTRRVPGEHAQSRNGQTAAHRVARKVTRMVISVIVAFEVSYAPVFFGLVFPYLHSGRKNQNFLEVTGYQMLMISNGIFNALIYAIFNENFLRAFKEALYFNPLAIVLKNICTNSNQINNNSSACLQYNISSTRITEQPP